MDKFSERLKEALKASGISQSELARKIGMSQDSVNSYCKGKMRPSFDVIISICKALDESADFLLGLVD